MMKVDLLVDFNFEPTKETMETFCQIHKPKNLVKKTKFCKNPVNPFMIDLFFTNKPSSFQNFTTYMACNGVLTPLPSKSNPPKSVTIPPVLKFFTPPFSPILKLFTLPSDWKWLLLHFSHLATSNKHMFIFLKLLELTKCCHN